MRIFGLGPLELVLIVGVILVLFGPSLIPRITKSFNGSVKAMREGVDAMDLTEGEDEVSEKGTVAKAAESHK